MKENPDWMNTAPRPLDDEHVDALAREALSRTSWPATMGHEPADFLRLAQNCWHWRRNSHTRRQCVRRAVQTALYQQSYAGVPF